MILKLKEEQSLCEILDLGLIDYTSAWDFQKKTVEQVIQGGKDTLILCEHPPVLTLGRLAKDNNILYSPAELSREGVKIVPIDRGGEVTLHSPGQLVIYPIFNLTRYGRDLKVFLETLEQVAIDLLLDFGIVANSLRGGRGVWVKERKIASIGIGVKKWVSFHGMAINVNTNLDLFKLIKPCGLDVEMTSLQALTGRPVDMNAVKKSAVSHFSRHFSI